VLGSKGAVPKQASQASAPRSSAPLFPRPSSSDVPYLRNTRGERVPIADDPTGPNRSGFDFGGRRSPF